MSLSDIHQRAERFQTRIKWRNWIEYGAGALVAAAFGAIAIDTPDWGIRAGAALTIAGVIYVCWQMGVRGGATRKDEGQSWVEFHRAELVRQRDALASVWRWYIGPLVPGVLAIILATVFTPAAADIPLAARAATGLMSLAWVALIFGGVGWLNARGARKLEAEIEALDRARER